MVVLIYLSICVILPTIEYHYYYYTAYDAGSVFRDLSNNLGANFVSPALFLPIHLFNIDIWDNVYRNNLPFLLLLLSSFGSAFFVLLILIILFKIDRFFLKSKKRYELFLIPLLFFSGTFILNLVREAIFARNLEGQHSFYHEKYEFDTPVISDAKFIYPEVVFSNSDTVVKNTDIVISDINSENKVVIKSFPGQEIGYISPNGKYGFVLTKNPYGGKLVKTIISIETGETFDFCNDQKNGCGDNIIWSPQGTSFLYNRYIYGPNSQESDMIIKRALTLFELASKSERKVFESNYDYTGEIYPRNSFAWVDEKSIVISNYDSSEGKVYYASVPGQGEISLKIMENLKACLSVEYLNQHVYCFLSVKDLYPDLNFPDKNNEFIVGGNFSLDNENIDYDKVSYVVKQNLQQINKNDIQIVTKSPINTSEARKLSFIDSNYLFISPTTFTNRSEYIVELQSGMLRRRKISRDPYQARYLPNVPDEEIQVFYSGRAPRVLSTRPTPYIILD